MPIDKIETSALKHFEATLSTEKMNPTQKLAMIQAMLDHDGANMDETIAKTMRAIRDAEAAKQASSLRNPAMLAFSSASALLYGAAGGSAIQGKTGLSAVLLRGQGITANSSTAEVAKATGKAAAMYGNFANVSETGNKIANSRLEANRVEYKSNQDLAQAEESDRAAAKQSKKQKEEQNDNLVSTIQQQEARTKEAMVR